MADIEGYKASASGANASNMLRTAQQIQYQLSQMADQKASMLMAATFVIFTITIGQARDGKMPASALMVLGGFAFISAILAVLAVLPAVGPSKGGRINLLFFGSFSTLDEEDYVERLLATLESDDTMFRTMATDIFQNGRVLARKKYKLLGYAYRVFLVGLVASLITFLIYRF
jgi:hypothetical protein